MARYYAVRAWRISSWGAVSDLILGYIALSMRIDNYSSQYITIPFFSNIDLSWFSKRHAGEAVAPPIILHG